MRLIIVVLIALAASVLGAGTAHAAAWLPGPTLTQTASVASPSWAPQTAIGADGGSAVMSMEINQFNPLISNVVVRRVGPDGAQLGPLPIGQGIHLDIVALPGGGYRVAWIAPGPPSNRVMTATIDATGRVSGLRALADVEWLNGEAVGAIGADGSVVVAWEGQATPTPLRVRQIAADGTASPIADLGTVADLSYPVQLVRADDGSARLLWQRQVAPNVMEQMVGRVTAAGVATSTVLEAGELGGEPRMAVGGGDPVVTWGAEGTVDGRADIHLARLPSSGPVAAAATTVASDLLPVFSAADVALAADGTATVVWVNFDSQWNSSTLASRQVAPGGALGPVREVSATTGFVELDVSPRVEVGRDGTYVVQWFRGFPANDAVVSGFGKVLDSTGAPAGPELAVPHTVTLTQAFSSRVVDLTVAPSGTGLLVGVAPAPGGVAAINTVRFDATPPALDPAVPAAVRGSAAPFSARASDANGIAKVTWDFGDGLGGEGADVTHVYHSAGARTVTVTATDVAGESTTVTREIAVGDPPPTPTPPGPPGRPGGGAGTPGPTVKLASADLRVTKATRKGSRVTVTGTIDRRARGQITVTWAQKSGRKTVKRTARAKIVRGRFTATITLTRALARSRVAGRLTVTYGGDSVLARANVARTVKAPARKATRKKR